MNVFDEKVNIRAERRIYQFSCHLSQNKERIIFYTYSDVSDLTYKMRRAEILNKRSFLNHQVHKTSQQWNNELSGKL